MRLKLIMVSIGMLLPILTTYAQYAEDALRYSGSIIQGTARFQGMAGAQTALGADVSSIAGNPAGLGFFRKSEWSITPSIGFSSSNSAYLDNTNITDNKSNFNIANMGIVFSGAKDDIIPGNWRGGSFGISFSRMNNFNNRFSYGGTNQRNSFLDFLVDEARGLDAFDLESEYQTGGITQTRSGAAYNTFLINPQADSVSYYRFNDGGDEFNPFIPPRQESSVNTSGAQYQWNFSYGGNFADKLYFGASLGISRLRYTMQEDYIESFPGSDIINNFAYTENLDVRGTGVNLSLGVIYRLNDMVRLGGSVVTPTFYRITENFDYAITPDFQDVYLEDENNSFLLSDVNDITVTTEPRDFIYNLTTPLRITGGIALFAQKNGFISADVEYVGYNMINLNNDDNFFSTGEGRTEIDIIRNNYRSAINARIGGEFRKEIFRVRGGVGYQADPYRSEVNPDLNRHRLNFTAGAGVRLETFYFDFAVVHTRFNSGYTPYGLSDQATASVTTNNTNTNAVFTFGMFF